MTKKDLTAAYRTIAGDHFPACMEIAFIDDEDRQTLSFEKVTWTIEGEERGSRAHARRGKRRLDPGVSTTNYDDIKIAGSHFQSSLQPSFSRNSTPTP